MKITIAILCALSIAHADTTRDIVTNEAEKACEAEVKKDHPDKKLLEIQCLIAANKLTKTKHNTKESWYYLLAGKYSKNLEGMKSHTRYLLYSYLLDGNTTAVKSMFEYLTYDMSKNAPKVKKEFSILQDIYPTKKSLLQSGYDLWISHWLKMREPWSLYIDSTPEDHKWIENIIALKAKSFEQNRDYQKAATYYLFAHRPEEILRLEKKATVVDELAGAVLLAHMILDSDEKLKEHFLKAARENAFNYYDDTKKNIWRYSSIKNRKILRQRHKMWKSYITPYIAYKESLHAYMRFERKSKILLRELENSKASIDKWLGTKCVAMAEISSKLAYVYEKRGMDENAIEEGIKTLTFIKDYTKEAPNLIINTYKKIARLYNSINKPNKALEYYKERLSLSKIWLKYTDDEYINAYRDAITAYDRVGDKKSSKIYCKR